MSRCLLFLVLASLLPVVRLLGAGEDGPPIAITSPDAAVTFAFSTIKSHALIWDEKRKLLIAQVVFVDTGGTEGQAPEDEHDFRLPGVSFDAAKGLFYAVSARGESIPVARLKKTLFLKSIVVLPNANVRIQHPHGEVTVILEAISPNDPSLRAPPPEPGPDDTQNLNIKSILN